MEFRTKADNEKKSEEQQRFEHLGKQIHKVGTIKQVPRPEQGGQANPHTHGGKYGRDDPVPGGGLSGTGGQGQEYTANGQCKKLGIEQQPVTHYGNPWINGSDAV